MASPTVDLNSSARTTPEDADPEQSVPRALVGRERQAPSKGDSSKSPPAEPRGKGVGSKKGQSSALKANGLGMGEDGGDGSGQQQPSAGRKKRSRATPSEDCEANGRKSVSDLSGRESSLWPGGEGEGPVQGSLLEEVLAEKRMALMRSPEVVQFLQQKQVMQQAAHSQAPVMTQQSDFSVHQLEEDANS